MEILKSIFIGMSIAAIPGPIFFELLRRTLSQGLRSGVLLVIGEFVGNLTLLLLISLGLAPFLEHDIVKTILYVIGALILFYLSYDAFKLSRAGIEKSYAEKDSKDMRGSFLVGLGIAASSPIVIALWVSLSGSYLQQFPNTFTSSLNAAAIALGFLLFFIPLAFVVYKTRHRIPPHIVMRLSKIFGIVLLIFGIILLTKV